MSAWIVSHRHIDLLVETAMFGPAGTRRNWHTFTYYHRTPNEPDLSAGRERTIRPGDYDAANRLGRLLLNENARSVNYRYPDDPELPADDDTYQCRTTARLSAVDVLMALDGYEYQSCEHPRLAHQRGPLLHRRAAPRSHRAPARLHREQMLGDSRSNHHGLKREPSP